MQISFYCCYRDVNTLVAIGLPGKALIKIPEKIPTCKWSIDVYLFNASVPRGLQQFCKIPTYCNLVTWMLLVFQDGKGT